MHQRNLLLLSLLMMLFFAACQPNLPTSTQAPIADTPAITQPPFLEPTAAVTPEATSTEHVVVLATETPAQWNEMDVINDLKVKIQANHLVNGWIWQSVEYDHLGFREFTPSLPDGAPFPANYFKETWYHINDQKLVDQYIEFTKSVEGEILATVIYTNGYIYSPYLDQPKEQEAFSMGDFDGELLDRMLAFSGNNNHKLEQKELDGKIVMCLTAFDEWGATMPGYSKIVQAVVGEGCYDQETGWQLQVEGRYLFEDGTEEVTSRTKLETIPGRTPPPEILQQIETASS